MPVLPVIPEQQSFRKMTDVFSGYNHKLKIGEGEFYDTGNLSTAYYPLLSSREPRGRVRSFTQFQGMCALNGRLAYVDNGTLYYDGEETPITGLSPGEKQLVPFGAYICIFPDKLYFNTVKAEDSGSMEASFSFEGVNLEYRMCDIDGVEYSQAQKSETAPDNPAEGALWIDTRYGKLMIYSKASWVHIEHVFTKIIFAALPAGSRPSDIFKANDGVEISGSSVEGINGSKILYAIGETYIVVAGVLDNSLSYADESLTVTRKVPDMDFVIECQNRLWGCYYGSGNGGTVNEIYCCVLGDFKNWNRFLGISTDAYIASVGTDGEWTGAVNYLGYPTFFKENCIHRVAVSPVGAHQISPSTARGVQKGSHKSLAIINETLFYKSREDVCAYQGGFPMSVSQALGDVKYSEGVSGSIGDRYYLSMKGPGGEKSLFVLDTEKGLWIREDNGDIQQFCLSDGELYAVFDGELWAMSGSRGEPESKVPWYAESGLLYYEYPDKKYVSRYSLRLKMERESRLKILIEYDSDGIWRASGEIFYKGTGTVTVPIRPRRCDHMRIRLEGSGFFRLYSITKMLELGSDY